MKRHQETSDLEMIFNQEEILPDLLNGLNISLSKDKKESCWPDLKSQPLLLSSQELYKKIAVTYFHYLVNVLLKLLRKYSPEDSKQKSARLTA